MYMLCEQGQVYYGRRDIRRKTNNATGPFGKITLFLRPAQYNILHRVLSSAHFLANITLLSLFFGGKVTLFLRLANIIFLIVCFISPHFSPNPGDFDFSIFICHANFNESSLSHLKSSEDVTYQIFNPGFFHRFIPTVILKFFQPECKKGKLFDKGLTEM